MIQPATSLASCTDNATTHYTYDSLSQLSSENSSSHSFLYTNDSLYNRTQKNDQAAQINPLNELLSLADIRCSYDPNGNQISKQTPSETFHFTYDPLNRLTQASSEETKVHFTYDPLGRRLSKITSTATLYGWKETSREHYLYDGYNEIGALTTDGTPKNLRILGLAKHNNSPRTIAIELDGQPFAPILDIQGNILRLVDCATHTLAQSYTFTAFGEELQNSPQGNPPNPWRFASKRFDPELSLIYFGKRYYDPELARWLTTDPAGFVDSANLYQYLFNNPFRYVDPHGDFVWLLLLPAVFPLVQVALPALSISLPTLASMTTFLSVGLVAATSYAAMELSNSSKEYTNEYPLRFNTRSDNVISKAQPPYSGKELGNDPTKCPGKGFEWRGKGKPGSKEGNWYNPETKESLHPDLDHPPPKSPHWDYESPDFPDGIRLNLDGSWEPKL